MAEVRAAEMVALVAVLVLEHIPVEVQQPIKDLTVEMGETQQTLVLEVVVVHPQWVLPVLALVRVAMLVPEVLVTLKAQALFMTGH